MNEKLRSAIYGFAVGDALGVPYEFKQRGTFECTGMIGHGTWNQKAGTWSDDTSMTLATCDSIRQCGRIDPTNIMEKFLEWYSFADYTAHKELFDIGNTTQCAIARYKATRDAMECGLNDINSNGNGSLMRILPLAFVDNVTGSDVSLISALTHAHDVSTYACRSYVYIAKRLMNGETFDSIFKRFVVIFDYTVFKRLTSIGNLTESEIKSTGYVVDTLEAALWCVSTTESYMDCVLKAVNLGGDTDTIAAIAGGLAGIIYGYEAIPSEWIDKLANKELIDKCLF